MPLLHVCNWRGCNEIIPQNHKYCDYHYRLHLQSPRYQNRIKKLQADRRYNHTRRDQEANRFYHSKRWTRTRDAVKNRDFMVSGASGQMLNDHDYIVDHIVKRDLCDDKFDMNNLWLLSRAEHNTKTKLEQKLSDNQLKTMTKTQWRRLINMKVGDNNG